MPPLNEVTANTRRVLQVTPGNLRQSHLYVNRHYDFFPADCIGSPTRSSSDLGTIDIHLDGLDQMVTTDIARNAATGKPRGFFRARGLIRRFYEHHGVKAGESLTLERLSERTYRLSVQHASGSAPLPLVCAEFFAGIGLVRLALERQEWRVVFANDIDPKKAEMYRHNWPDSDHLVVGDIHALE
ncbi:MAG: DNA cytosine methyltransferase, partial [Patescibacteria group bacterium]|nr:DNA cytosine methyltransferase [Patescibacteria group bacterium]